MRTWHVMLVVLSVLGCKKEEPAAPPSKPAAAPTAKEVAKNVGTTIPETAGDGPLVIGGGGKRVPAGYVTTFTGPSGPVKLDYTQISGADIGGKLGMRVSFEAVARGLKPDEPLTAGAQIARLGGALKVPFPVKAHADLAGKVIDQFDPMQGSTLNWGSGDGIGAMAKVGRIEITAVTAEAIEGTFTAELYDSPMDDAKLVFKITDGKFRAYPAEIVSK